MRGGVLSYYAEKENHPDNRWRSHRTNEDARGRRKAQRERNHRNVFSGVPGSVQGFRQGYREGQAETLIPAGSRHGGANMDIQQFRERMRQRAADLLQEVEEARFRFILLALALVAFFVALWATLDFWSDRR